MHPPPSCPGPLCMGRAPPRPARKAFVLHQFSLVPEYLPPRVGADLCVRPDTSLHGTRSRADTQVGPYGVDRNTHQPQKSGRGQSPAPTGRSRCQAAGRCGHRPLRKGRKAAATTRASGAERSVCGADGRKGWELRQRASTKCPATSGNPSVAAFGRASSLCTREPFPAGDGRTHRSAPTRPSECPVTPDGAGQSPPPTGAPGVPACGPMYRRHGPCRPNFVPKFGASVIGIGPYERTGIRIFTSPAGPQLPIPRDSGKVSKGRAEALPLVVGGVWGRNRNAPRIFLRDCQGGFFQFGKNPP